MTFPNRTAEPGTVITFHGRDGEIEMTADAHGLVSIHNAEEDAIATSFGLGRTTDAHSPATPTVADLKARAKELGLPTGGKKADLEERIAAAAAPPEQEDDAGAPPDQPAAADDAAHEKDGES